MKIPFLDIFKYFVGVFIACIAINSIANDDSSGSKITPASSYQSVNDWLVRIHEASRRRSYTGTFVVSVGSEMASARIWHVCDGIQQMERVESLTGTPRSTFRHNNRVTTFFPESKIARSEQRDALSLFPNFINSSDSAIANFYNLKAMGSERVAGVDTDIVELLAKDVLRFSYRIWTEHKSGLVVKLQTLDTTGKILEQAAFSELSLDAPVKMEHLVAMMNNTAGHRLEQVEMIKTTALSQGWALQRVVPGFSSMNCYKRPAKLQSASAVNRPEVLEKADTMQWIFSDGLAAVSLFVESYDRKRHNQEGVWSMGSTNTLAKRIDSWWLTAVGEVPVDTLLLFANQLERKNKH